MLKVKHFQRRPAAGQVSIERVFAEVRRAMPPHIQCALHQSPFPSRGVARRLANLADVARAGAQVNHILGDVHYLTLGLPGARTLLTIHDCVSLERLRGLKRTLFRWFWYDLPVRRARLVSVVSEATRGELLRHVRCDPAKIRVIHNCIGREFAPSPRPINKHCPVILQVGTAPHKNLARVAAALRGIRCRLNIIGPLTVEGQKQTQGVQFASLGHVSAADLVRTYQESDVVMFASTYEGFGLPILEAQAVGRPVITSQLLSMPEVAGSGACFVDPHQVGSIRQGVLRVLADADYRNSLVAAGLANVKRFAPATIAAQYAEAYKTLSGWSD